MTGDWASSVQILRAVGVCDVSMVVLDDIDPTIKIVNDVDSFSPTLNFLSGEMKL